MAAEKGIDVLIRFARLASEAGTGAKLLPLLADALVQHAHADGVAIVELQESGETRVVPTRHLPAELAAVKVEVDELGSELGPQLLSASGGRFREAHAKPMVGGTGLFGTVVLLFTNGIRSNALALAEGLIDLAAIALASEAQVRRLARSHAELRASQETLARSEKLRALGQMAAGVSHDLKNILNPLSLHIQVSQRAIDRNKLDDAKESLVEMRQVVQRGVETVERLREYSRQTPESKTEEVDLNKLVHEAAQIARPRMSSRGGALNRIREELGAPPRVMGRSGEIVNALVNLVVNAIDAMPDGGTITLRTGETNSGAWAQVQDEGPGMPPDVEKRAFEPFFTTKGTAGTGLGLATVYACMQRHGGSVKLETAPGKGTTFTLWFPAPAQGA